jgi:Trk K+ transport system NAD-binding subunit
MMASGKRGFGARFRYGFDNLMSKGGMSVFLALMALFVAAIVLMAILRFVVNLIAPEDSMSDLAAQWWRSFLQIADGGSIAEDSESNALNRVVGIIALFLGMVLFSSLVAFITSQFEALIENMKRGRSPVLESGHTLLLGFGDRALEIARELVIANESEARATIVVLAEAEKTDMDEFFRERIESWKTTRIVTRSGSTSSQEMLRRVGIEEAKSVIVLNGAGADAEHHEKELADARVIKTILAVLSTTGEERMPPVVAELHNPAKQELARSVSGRISIIDEHSILAKLMVQTSRVSGLAQLYDSIVGFEGCEFYFRAPEGGLAGVEYRELLFRYPECAVMGFRRADGGVSINPPASTRLAAGDEALLLAEDDSMIRYAKQAVSPAIPASPPPGTLPRTPERQLIVGWCTKAPTIIDEYAKYLVEGSAIDLVIEEANDSLRADFAGVASGHPGIAISLLEMDIDDPAVIERLRPERYDNVILLSPDGGESELKDSDTIAKLLGFRLYFRKLGDAEVKTQLITEVSDSDNIDIIRETGVKDFLISNKLVSKIYAQVSEEPGVLDVYEQLFAEEGSEIYLKPASVFLASLPAEASFGELCAAALARGETCLGVRLAAEAEDASRHFGLRLNPPKERRFMLGAGDQLITLAENET